jgi:hypothetical protein
MKNQYEQILEFSNIHRAYLDARKCKRYRSSILKFGCKIEANLLAIKRELTDGSYKHGGYREFIVSDSKKRHIKAAPFRDRVVHHALCNIIEPILDKGFISDSYACRKGKGTHAAVKRLERFIRSISANPGRVNGKIYIDSRLRGNDNDYPDVPLCHTVEERCPVFCIDPPIKTRFRPPPPQGCGTSRGDKGENGCRLALLELGRSGFTNTRPHERERERAVVRKFIA